MTISFLQPNYTEVELPDMLVLGTDKAIKDLMKQTIGLPEYAPDANAIAEIALEMIRKEREGIEELSANCLALSNTWIGTMYHEETRKVYRLILEFGTYLFGVLQYLRAYTNGYLIYKLGGWLGGDIILTKLSDQEVYLRMN